MALQRKVPRLAEFVLYQLSSKEMFSVQFYSLAYPDESQQRHGEADSHPGSDANSSEDVALGAADVDPAVTICCEGRHRSVAFVEEPFRNWLRSKRRRNFLSTFNPILILQIETLEISTVPSSPWARINVQINRR